MNFKIRALFRAILVTFGDCFLKKKRQELIMQEVQDIYTV
jgi:hypothetical protein